MMKKLILPLVLAVMPAVALAEGDVTKGEKVFRKCKACHTVGEKAKNGVGPHLNGIVDRPVASVEGFNYSEAMKGLGEEGAIWTAEELSAYLIKPKDYLKGTAMVFVGLKKEADRDNLIAYLASFE